MRVSLSLDDVRNRRQQKTASVGGAGNKKPAEAGSIKRAEA
jgi:hypothetical protein